MTKRKAKYYEADTGFFGIPVKVCFDEAGFNKAVLDSKITTRHQALDIGIAEAHFITQDGTTNAMLAIVFDLPELTKLSDLEQMGVIYHEVSHTVTHVYQYVGEDPDKIGDESRSYLGEHLFKQVFTIYAMAREAYECNGKGNRKLPEQRGKTVEGALIQMAEQYQRGAGSDSNFVREGSPSGTKKSDGSSVSKAEISIQPNGTRRSTGARTKIEGRRR